MQGNRTNAAAQADTDKLKEDRLLEGGTTETLKKECNNCITEGCKGCSRIMARKPGMHAIGWKQQLTRAQPGMSWAQMVAPDEN